MLYQKKCKYCNSVIPKYHSSHICQSCCTYLRNHPEGFYELPPKGEVYYAPNGDVICHICGQAHRKLGSHIVLKHKMTQQEYRDEFKLYHNTRLSNKDYIKKMKNYTYKYKDIVINDNLIEKGKKTRITADFNTPGRKYQYTIKETTVE